MFSKSCLGFPGARRNITLKKKKFHRRNELRFLLVVGVRGFAKRWDLSVQFRKVPVSFLSFATRRQRKRMRMVEVAITSFFLQPPEAKTAPLLQKFRLRGRMCPF
jgi:hypothetical protein